MNKIVIFGQYRTGTTALFFKIRQSLPKAKVYELFEPERDIPSDDSNNITLAKVILGIDTLIDYDPFLSFDKQIYLARDPRDWFISGLLFLLQQEVHIYSNVSHIQHIIQLLEQKEQQPDSISVIELFKTFMRYANRDSTTILDWVEKQINWLLDFESQLTGAVTIRYEDLVDDNVTALEDYLEFPILRGQADVSFEHVARTKEYGHWRNWFLEEDCEILRPIFEPYLRQHGYSSDWSLNKKQIIKPEHCSYYAKRVIEQRAQKQGIENIVTFLGKEHFTMGTFTTHTYTDGDEIDINNGFNEIFGVNRSIKDWQWKFAPVYEKSWIIIARDEQEEVIAQYAVIHEPMQIRGQQIHAGQPVDVYRIRRPSTADQKVFARTVLNFFDTFCAPDKLAYLFGFPGKHALHVGQTQLGYGDAIPIHIWHKPVPKRGFLDSLRKVIPTSIEDADLATIDDLWLRAMHRYPFALIRDRHRIQRRFIDYPERDYYYIAVKTKSQLHAWAILRDVDGVLKWVDLVWDGQAIKDLQRLEQDIVRLAQSLSIDRIEMWILGDESLINFLKDHDWQKEIDPFVHLVGRTWHPDLDAQEIIQNMYITLGDSDLI